jgi:hypothetical protein
MNYKKPILYALSWMLLACSSDDNETIVAMDSEPALPTRIITDRADGLFSDYNLGYDDDKRITTLKMVTGKRIENSSFDEIINSSNISISYDSAGKPTSSVMEHDEDSLQVRFDWKYDSEDQLAGMDVTWPSSSNTYDFDFNPTSGRLTYTAASLNSAFPFWVDFNENGSLAEASFAVNGPKLTYYEAKGIFDEINPPRALTLLSLYIYIIYDRLIPLQFFQLAPFATYTNDSGSYRAEDFQFDTEDRLEYYELTQELPPDANDNYQIRIEYLEQQDDVEETR